MHHRRCLAFGALLVAAVATSRSAPAQEGFEGWHLEPGVGQAHLVMVARVASISSLTVVEGAKTDVALREYRFQPIRRLKGLFQREQLSMTASDLGCAADDPSRAPPLKEGEFRLLILAQQQGQTWGCVSAAPGASTFDERVPKLTGPDDPLVAVVETLIRVADSQSRRERAALLVERLESTEGIATTPLLSSLRLRADVAPPRAYEALARLVADPRVAVRRAALEVLRDMLAYRIAPDDPRQLDGVADALRSVLESDEAITQVQLAALEAMEYLLALRPDLEWPREVLIARLDGAATQSERAAAALALARVKHVDASAALLDALAGLPLDEAPDRERQYARASVRADASGAERALLTRLTRSIAARESLEAEIEQLTRLRSAESLPLLLAAAGQPHLSSTDRWYIAAALGKLGDDRGVAVLIDWLRGDDYQLREAALSALEILDTEMAAREARPMLKSEAHLPYKLRIARLLARHGIADGYALASEHLADDDYTALAALVLAALDDPRTASDLSGIIAARPERGWRAAALTGLAATGDPDARRQLLAILKDDRQPLAARAAEAAGLAGDSELLPPLAKFVQSRNRQIAMSALVALRRFASGVRNSPRGLAAADWDPNQDALEANPSASEIPTETRETLSAAVASIVLDAYVDTDLRQEGLSVARRLGGDRYSELLSQLSDQAELEGTPLLAMVQAERRRQRGIE